MSDQAKDWLKGSLAGWVTSILLGVFSFLGVRLLDKVEEMQDTMIRDREELKAAIVRDREKASEAAASQNQRIGLVEYKLDLLTRSIADLKKK